MYYESPFGRVIVTWTRTEKTIRLDISMPDGTYGKAVLRDGYRFENGDTVVYLNGGQYGFKVKNNV